jgi:hypothetical protein
VPNARDVPQRVEHVAAVIEPDCGDPSHRASVWQLLFLKRVVIPPRATKILKSFSWHNADLGPSGIEFLIPWHSASLGCRLTVKLRGRTEAPALGAEGAQSLRARGA